MSTVQNPQGEALASLIDRSVDELRRRDPAFLSWHDVTVSADAIEASILRCDPERQALSDPERADSVRAAADYCAQALRAASAAGADEGRKAACDAVAEQLASTCAEAILVQRGRMALEPGPRLDAEAFAQAMRADYAEVQTAAGRCLVRNRGQRTVLLISALGIPLSIWSSFLLDGHDYRIVVPEMLCSDLFLGGMRSVQSAREHAQHIDALLRAAGIGAFDVIAWCNGGRIAIELAALAKDRIGKLIFLSPTFRGADDAPGEPSEYENKLEQVFSVVRRNPKAAGYVAGMLAQLTAAPDWAGLPADEAGSDRRARLFFGLPARDRVAGLLAPMTGADNLCNYAARTSADEALSRAPATLPADADVHLICGDSDAVVSNAHTEAYLRRCTRALGLHVVTGAGHYVHDLQYPYFRWIIDRIFNGAGHGHPPLRVQPMHGSRP